jgi:hypothetical protein
MLAQRRSYGERPPRTILAAADRRGKGSRRRFGHYAGRSHFDQGAFSMARFSNGFRSTKVAPSPDHLILLSFRIFIRAAFFASRLYPLPLHLPFTESRIQSLNSFVHEGRGRGTFQIENLP